MLAGNMAGIVGKNRQIPDIPVLAIHQDARLAADFKAVQRDLQASPIRFDQAFLCRPIVIKCLQWHGRTGDRGPLRGRKLGLEIVHSDVAGLFQVDADSSLRTQDANDPVAGMRNIEICADLWVGPVIALQVGSAIFGDPQTRQISGVAGFQ